MKKIKCCLLLVLTMAPCFNAFSGIVATHDNALVLSVKGNTDGYCFIRYKTVEGSKYYGKWECSDNVGMLGLAKTAYITGAPVTITLSSTGAGSSTGDDLASISLTE